MGDVFMSGKMKMNPNYIQDKVLPELDKELGIDELAIVSWIEWIARKVIQIVKSIEKLFGK